jgi:cytochrome c553
MNPRFHALLLAAALASATPGASAQEKRNKGAQAAAGDSRPVNVSMCIGCHGIPGYKTAFPEVYHVPRIAGQSPVYLENALKAYRAGQRPHPSMRGIAGDLSDEQIAGYAKYYGGAK